jgi:diguanylate cyclase (GGDEF)-like protein
MTDVTDRKLAEERLLYDALHDGLTGLPNRALFADRLGLALKRPRGGAAREFAVLFLDLDRFKNINDSLGHGVGDELLVQISRRFAETLRPGDTVARLGGDEFALLIHDVDGAAEASRVAERLQAVLMHRFVVGSHEVFTSASIGIALSSGGYREPEEMLRDADIAMYRAKAAGKARYEVFDREMHRSAVALLSLETDLRQALARDEFLVHYQPIVDLADLRIVGFETLTRWRHPKRGLLRPELFIAVAEETGLTVPLGWWVLAESCGQIAAWRRTYPGAPGLSVSCNITGKLFRGGDVVDRLVELLERFALPPEALKLEITENVVMDDDPAVLTRLSQVRALGVQIQIDDFGTGYSSLSYLQRFHCDTLKIDRSFVSRLKADGNGQAIVKTIVALGQHLKMNVIAEGIETAEQMQLLRDLACPQGQGYWFARPIPAASAEVLLAEQFPVS